MGTAAVRNWFGNVTWTPRAQVTPKSLEEIIAIVKDRDNYPSPIRAVGSNHSTTPCAAAPEGTTMYMSAMTKIVAIDVDARTVTAEPGALYIDVAKALEAEGLQFYVNIELGDLTMGAAATVGTKEGAFPGEHGQVSSYLKSAKIVHADGELAEITEDDFPLIQAFRSSYGTFGVTVEVTFSVRPIEPMSVRHYVYSLDSYLAALPSLLQSEQSLMTFMDPMLDRIAVECRSYHQASKRQRYSHWQWKIRNFLWKDVCPGFAYLVHRFVPTKWLRSLLWGLFNRLSYTFLRLVIRGKNTVASDQQIHYPLVADNCKYTFSIWAYPVDRYPDALRHYFQFCKDYYRDHGFRVTMMSVGYRTYQDQQALLSYSYNGEAVTIDPVTTPEPGWDDFLQAYDTFALSFGGQPLLNQTAFLTRAGVVEAYGDRLATLAGKRAEMDPAGRFLSPYFNDLLN